MGKVSIIAAILFSLVGFILLSNMQQTSRETDIKQTDYLSSQLSRELATKGRQLILAGWMNNGGNENFVPQETSFSQDGGTISITDLSVAGPVIDFKSRGTYNGDVHEIRSRFQYNNFSTDIMQFKVADMHMSIHPGAQLINFNSIAIDDQALLDLENTIVDDLGLAPSLGSLGLGADTMIANIQHELDSCSNCDIGVNLINENDRNTLDDGGEGIYFPDQVQQAVEKYLHDNPGTELTVSTGSLFPAAFGGSGHSVLRIQDDVTITAGNQIAGDGILIVEGNLVVEDNATFNWNGVILVIPPSDNLNPQIDFTGPTSINGMIIAIQETIPNSGHMDVTTFRDMSGVWSSPYGAELYQSFWPWWLFHTHDYTAEEGNSIVFYDQQPPQRIHEDHIYLHDTFQSMAPNDSIFFEFFNRSNHGRAIMTVDLTGSPEVNFSVAAGFDSTIVNPGDNNRSAFFRINQLQRIQVDVTRLSALKKMWDDSENPFPDCTTWGGTNGAICVGETHYRQNALTLRMYKQKNGIATRVYETAMYWHRQEVEEDEFEDEMQDYVDQLTSSDYGLDFTLGDSTIISITDDVISSISPLGEIRQGFRNLTNLGTWHQHWESNDPDNPLYQTPSSDD